MTTTELPVLHPIYPPEVLALLQEVSEGRRCTSCQGDGSVFTGDHQGGFSSQCTDCNGEGMVPQDGLVAKLALALEDAYKKVIPSLAQMSQGMQAQATPRCPACQHPFDLECGPCHMAERMAHANEVNQHRDAENELGLKRAEYERSLPGVAFLVDELGLAVEFDYTNDTPRIKIADPLTILADGTGHDDKQACLDLALNLATEFDELAASIREEHKRGFPTNPMHRQGVDPVVPEGFQEVLTTLIPQILRHRSRKIQQHRDDIRRIRQRSLVNEMQRGIALEGDDTLLRKVTDLLGLVPSPKVYLQWSHRASHGLSISVLEPETKEVYLSLFDPRFSKFQAIFTS